MATHDYVIDNSTGANVRADINSVLQAILTNNSSSSAPSTTAAYMFWADTTSGTLKIRNSSDNAWVELLQLDGTLTLEDGSASTPALAFRDDLNTGIFSSAADTFNVATGGVERMELGATTIFNESGADVDFRIEGDSEVNLFYVDAGNDQIGIGTSSPLTRFHVEGSQDSLLFLKSTDAGSGLAAADNSGSSIIQNIGGSLRIFTGGDPNVVGTASTEKFRITGSGNVGIGTTSPGAPLTIDTGGTADALRIGNSAGTDTFIRLGSTSTNTDTHGVIKYDKDDNYLSLVVAGESHGGGGILIANGGNVGIGTSSPNNALDVQGGASNTAIVARSTDAKAQISLVDNSTTGVGSVVVGAEGDALFLTSGSGGTERLRIDSSGRLLINTTAQSTGTNSANAILTVNSQVGNATSAAILALRRGQASASIAQNNTLGRIVFCDSQAGEYAFIEGEADLGSNGVGDTAGRIAFSTSADGSSAPTERMRIDSSGRVIIGSTSTIGNSFTNNLTVSEASGSVGMQFEGNNSNNHYASIYFGDAGVRQRAFFEAQLGSDGNFTIGTGGSGPIRFNNSGGERMRIDGSGRLLLGTTTEGAAGADELTIAGAGNTGFTIRSGTTSEGNIFFSDGTSGGDEFRGVIRYAHNGNQFEFFTDGSRRLIMDSSGRFLINTETVGDSGANTLTVNSSGNTGITIRGGTSNNGSLFFSDATSGAAQYAGFVQYVHSQDAMLFGTASTERMRIDSSGNLLVGRSSSGNSGNGHTIRGGDSVILSRNASGETLQVCRNNSNGDLVQFRTGDVGTNASVCGEIVRTGSSSVAYQTSSDYRLKENEVAISDGITRLKLLKPYRFNFKSEPSKTVDGFYAHEVTPAVPEAIFGEKDDPNRMQGIDQSKLVPLLTAALQEAIVKIEVLETKVAALEAA